MEKPIDRIMRMVEWKALPMPTGEVDLPFATHEGVLDIGGFQFRAYQLNTGQRILNYEDVVAFFNREAP